MRIKARDISLLFWEKAAIYGQARFFEILQYFSSLSHSDQQHQQATEEVFSNINMRLLLKWKQCQYHHLSKMAI
ncbi:hypothetical protein WN943_024943 [Citrus x changshan-huyou]